MAAFDRVDSYCDGTCISVKKGGAWLLLKGDHIQDSRVYVMIWIMADNGLMITDGCHAQTIVDL